MKRVMICLVLVLAIAGCTPKKQEEVVEILTPVETLVITPSEIQNKMIYASQIKPEKSVQVISKITSKVKEVFFDLGDSVQEGDVLFTLDEEDINNQIKQLEAQLNIASQSVNTAENAIKSVTGGQYESQVLQQKTQIENYEKQIENARTAIKNAEIAAANASRVYENAKTAYDNAVVLFNAGAMSKTSFEQTELSYKQSLSALEQTQLAKSQAEVGLSQAESALSSAKEGYNLTTGQITQDNLEKAQLAYNQALASKESVAVQIAIAKENLDNAKVKSPITGIVSARTAKEGEYTSTQMPPFTIVNMDTVIAEVKISESLINVVKAQSNVNVYINSLQKEPFTGIITALSPAADATGMYPTKIKIDNKDNKIKPGMFCEVYFVKEESKNTIVLPRNAVIEDETAKYVYVNDQEVAKKVEVTTGIDNGESIEILSGLSEKDEVIVKGQSFVFDGEKIKVVSSNNEEASRGN